MWEISLSWQIQAFLWSVFFGATFCIAFDVLTIIEEKAEFSKAAVFIADMILFIFFAFFDFCFFLAFCNGGIRGFVYIGEIIGFFLCKKTLSLIYVPILLVIFKTIKSLFTAVYKRIVMPVSDFLVKIGKNSLKISQKALNFIKKGLKKPKRLVYTKEKCPKVTKRKEE